MNPNCLAFQSKNKVTNGQRASTGIKMLVLHVTILVPSSVPQVFPQYWAQPGLTKKETYIHSYDYQISLPFKGCIYKIMKDNQLLNFLLIYFLI